MIDLLQETFQKCCPFNFTRILVVGVSGGPDSLCLLDSLHKMGAQVVAAHLNHLLRAEADQDAEHVRRIADDKGIPFVIKEEDVGTFATVHSLSVEEAARILRYRFLFSEAEKRDAQAVVVGHTADDQAETVLMHILRGAGLDGLKGMEAWQVPNTWSKEIALARPLLGMWREETVAYCQENGLQPAIDLSNLERIYFRNRLRLEVIPILETHSPRLKERLVRLAEVVQGDLQILEPVVEAAWRDSLWETRDGYVAFFRKPFAEQKVGVQRRLVRKAMNQMRSGLRDIGYETVERALAFLNRPATRGQVDLASGLRLVVEGGSVWIATWEADLPGMGWPQLKGEPIRFSKPGSIVLEDGWQLDLVEVLGGEDVWQMAFENKDPYQTWLDADQISGEIEVRSRQEGDLIKPLGMEGHSVKITDLMINVKMPRRARKNWPMVCSPDEVLWLPGYATSHTSRVRPVTRRILHIRLARQS